jgi:LPS-assembly lipoprotein
MSLSEGIPNRICTVGKVIGLSLLLVIAQACTVTPLYGNRTGETESTAGTDRGQIAIQAPQTREEQQVRNHLLFLLNQGQGEPADPVYSLALGVTNRTIAAATQQTVFDPKANEGQPTSGTVIMTSDYVLRNAATGETVASGRRSVSADFDQPRQEFANDRAERNAQDRAARELAELLRLSLAQNLVGK